VAWFLRREEQNEERKEDHSLEEEMPSTAA